MTAIFPRIISHVIARLRKNGILTICEEHSIGREKVFALTAQRQSFAQPLLNSISAVELRSIELPGTENLEQLTALMPEYGQALHQALEEHSPHLKMNQRVLGAI